MSGSNPAVQQPFCTMDRDKITKYEEFLNETLKVDLKKLLDRRDGVYENIAHHLELRNTINTLQKAQVDKKPLKTKVDLGCNFYCSAKIDDPSRIFVRIGFGFYLEMTHTEALKFIAQRVEALERQAQLLGQNAVAVRAKIDMVLHALRELHGVSTPVDR
ncbi:protein UXT homolog isoform X2 [Pollicipes pollicipes]|uniref:protein UXT homolog isoform X2 n=1 Tax=Pollicipes pollicipes TaxID=41117 RepID=UPI001884E919|nr:protein UXT homolog isoform X2 [Pollicipes pollicipes]